MGEQVEKAGGRKRRLRGVVVCDRASKTVRVRIERRVRHPLYEKIIRRHRNVCAHDEHDKYRVGDVIVVEESPRFSKTKAWVVVDTAEEAK